MAFAFISTNSHSVCLIGDLLVEAKDSQFLQVSMIDQNWWYSESVVQSLDSFYPTIRSKQRNIWKFQNSNINLRIRASFQFQKVLTSSEKFPFSTDSRNLCELSSFIYFRVFSDPNFSLNTN